MNCDKLDFLTLFTSIVYFVLSLASLLHLPSVSLQIIAGKVQQSRQENANHNRPMQGQLKRKEQTMLTRIPALPNTFESLERDFGRLLSRMTDQNGHDATGAYPVDIREDKEHVYVEAELPGFTRDQVNVTLENRVLSIVAERGKPVLEEGTKEHLTERRFIRVARSFTMPETVDEGKVDAKLADGVLKLTLHKREEVKPRKIEVQ
jgi:HSP20 family molecular chaperone IbpA